MQAASLHGADTDAARVIPRAAARITSKEFGSLRIPLEDSILSAPRMQRASLMQFEEMPIRRYDSRALRPIYLHHAKT